MGKISVKPKKTYHFIFSVVVLLLTLTSIASAQVLIFSDNMTDFPLGWTTGGSGGPWTKDSTRYKTPSYSAKCTPNTTYDNNQDNWMEKTIDLTGYVSGVVAYQIWQNTIVNDSIFFEYYSGGNWVKLLARSGDYGGFAQMVHVFIPNTTTAIRFRFFSDSTDTAEGVYIDDVRLWGYRYDVGCTEIQVPTGTIDSGRVITPKARVRNFGDYISTFWVRMSIGSFYSNAVQVTNLSPGDSVIVNFPNWTVLQRGTHVVRCSTEHPQDINPLNDRMAATVTIRVIDVGTISIVAPTGTVDSGQVITPRAVTHNYGTDTETFNVYFKISDGYSSLRTITLNPEASETTNFDAWTALLRGNQVTNCSTALATDSVFSNNCQTGSVAIRVTDVGVVSILTPTNNVDSTATLIPQARMKNYGTQQESFTAKFRIEGPGVNWSNTATVSNLNPNEERTINFSSWNIGQRGNYTTLCSTELSGDQVSSNNKRDSTFVVRVHDVGVVSISSPPSSVDSSTTVSVSATVQNFGTENESFTVRFRIGSFYTSNRTVNLGPGSSTGVNFDNWTVNQPRNTYTARCSTMLSNDAKRNNDRQISYHTVNVHDVGVIEITAPSSQVDSNMVTPVSAQIKNYGTYSENFSVSFRIGSFYNSTRSISLSPGNSSAVAFDSWSITQPRGTYTTKCSTGCNTDLNPLNNIITQTTTVMVHDVGVVSINSPPGQVDTNSTVPVSATISNFGTYTESFNVIYKIGTFYSSTRTVNLSPNNSQNVAFDDWLVTQPRGNYPQKCSTQLSTDIVPSNNQQSGSVTINVHDVGVDAFSGLSPEVDSGTSTPIAATVSNYGTISESFDVNCKIGSVYDCTKSVNLNPGSSTVVQFDPWLPLVRNSHTIKCSTRLNTDLVHDNDFQVENIFVTVRDISAMQIIEPIETVAQEDSIIPKARFKNLGNVPATFPVSFQISFRSITLYFDELTINLEPDVDSTIQFNIWLPESLGTNITQIQCSLGDDMNPINNSMSGTINVITNFVWQSRCDLPEGGGRKVKKGGALVYVPPSGIYAFKGSNTNEFYRYDIYADAWVPVCTIPYTLSAKKRVKSGSALCYGNEYIYGLKGANTQEFWRYHVPADSWCQLKPVPLGTSGRRLKGGSGLVYLSKDGFNYVYCLKGSGTNEFYAYSVEGDSWLERKPAPKEPSGKGFKSGSCLVTDGLNNIYALKSKTNEFYVYDVTMDSWELKPILPFYGASSYKKKVKEGAAMTCDGMNLIYTLKGGNTSEFWVYDISQDTWLGKEPIPLGVNNRKVKAGGALCYANSVQRYYAFKGGNTYEFWMYVPLPTVFAGKKNPESGAMANQEDQNLVKLSLEIAPSPFAKTTLVHYQLPENDNIVLKLYDACGCLKHISILSQTVGTLILNGERLPVGVYILRLEGNKNILAKKVVISR